MSLLDELRAGRTTASAAETQTIARQLAAMLPADTTLARHGNLGVGKTTFVQGLAHGFGIREPVTSPTFNIYTVHRGATRTLIHLDACRLDNARQAEDLLLEDFLITPWCLAIEWPERLTHAIPGAIRVRIAIVDEHTRRITSTK